jgi:glycosyltransferase involved in cell wall biosynthesis
VNAADLRIAFVTGTLQLGGSTTFLLNLTGELLRRGISCRIYSGDKLHPFAQDFEKRKIPISLHDHERCIFEDRIAAVLREIRDYRSNVVVATLAPFAYEVLRYVPRGVLRLAVAQSDDPNVYRVLSHYAGFVDGVIGVSAKIAEQMRKMDVFRGIAVHCLPYGVVIPEQTSQRAQLGEPLRILYLGRIHNEQKRVRLFPYILARLQDAGIRFRWTIAGDGPDRAALEALMRTAATDQEVKFVGALAYAEVPRQLDLHDVFLLTSDYEGLPLSLLEAMGHGVVPVVSDLESGIREVVDANSGIRVPLDDVDGYARAIVHLYENPGELAAKSAGARERVQNEFSIAAMTDRWLSVLVAAPTLAEWPHHFCVHGPTMDPLQWKYGVAVRWVRRFLKFIFGDLSPKDL